MARKPDGHGTGISVAQIPIRVLSRARRVSIRTRERMTGDYSDTPGLHIVGYPNPNSFSTSNIGRLKTHHFAYLKTSSLTAQYPCSIQILGVSTRDAQDTSIRQVSGNTSGYLVSGVQHCWSSFRPVCERTTSFSRKTEASLVRLMRTAFTAV